MIEYVSLLGGDRWGGGSGCPSLQRGLLRHGTIGLSRSIDYFCLGTVFTVQAQTPQGQWETLFRRALLKKDAGWQHWEIPLASMGTDCPSIRLRFITDSYSRANDLSEPSWEWGCWGRPKLMRLTAAGARKTICDFAEHIDRAACCVRMDADGKDRPFDGMGEDSTGAVFRVVDSDIAAFAPHRDGQCGITIAQYEVSLREDR